MNATTNLLAGIGAGALAMYLLDPQQGRTRRAQITQKVNKLARQGREGLDAASRDAQNRLIGLWKEAAAKFAPDDTTDEALTARVRAAMGRKVSHPSAVLISCQDGNVTLSGDILAGEVHGLVSCAQNVKGVKEVYDELNVHNEPSNVSSLQGGRALLYRGTRIKPGPALVAGATGLGLLLIGAARKAMSDRRAVDSQRANDYLALAGGES